MKTNKLSRFISILFSVLEKGSREYGFDYTMNTSFCELFRGIIPKDQINRNMISRYIRNGMPDKLCRDITLATKKKILFINNLSDFINKNFNEKMLNELCQKTETLVKNLSADYLTNTICLPINTSDKIIKSFEVFCTAWTDGTDDVMLLSGAQMKPVREFYGRTDELVEIRRGLLNEGYTIIIGPDGLGKTKLVQKYLYEYRKHYDLILIPQFGNTVEQVISSMPVKKEAEAKLGLSRAELNELKKTILNKHGSKAVMYIDNAVVSNEIITEIKERYSFHIIMTASSAENGITNNASIISLGALPDAALSDILKKDMNEMQKDQLAGLEDSIIKLLCHNTLAVKLFAKAVCSGNGSVNDIYDKLKGGMMNDPDIRKAFRTLTAFDRRSDIMKQVLAVFAMFPPHLKIKMSLSRKLFGDTFPVVEDAAKEMLIQCDSSGYRENTFSMNPLIAAVVREKKLKSKNLDAVIRNIGNYAHWWSLNNEEEAVPVLTYIAEGMKDGSAVWTQTRGYIMSWLALHGKKERASYFFKNANAKKTLPDDVYLKLGDAIDKDEMQNREKWRQHLDESVSDRNNVIVQLNDPEKYKEFSAWSNNNKGDRLKHDSQIFQILLNSLHDHVLKHNINDLHYAATGLKVLLYSYRSPEAFTDLPENPDDEVMVNFLMEMADNDTPFKDAVLVKTAVKIFGPNGAEQLFGNSESFMSLISDSLVYFCLHDYYVNNNDKLLTTLKTFLKNGQKGFSPESEILWLTEAIFSISENLPDIIQISDMLDRHYSLLVSAFGMHFPILYAVVCFFYYSGRLMFNSFERSTETLFTLYQRLHNMFVDLRDNTLKQNSATIELELCLAERYAMLLFMLCGLIQNEEDRTQKCNVCIQAIDIIRKLLVNCNVDTIKLLTNNDQGINYTDKFIEGLEKKLKLSQFDEKNGKII